MEHLPAQRPGLPPAHSAVHDLIAQRGILRGVILRPDALRKTGAGDPGLLAQPDEQADRETVDRRLGRLAGVERVVVPDPPAWWCALRRGPRSDRVGLLRLAAEDRERVVHDLHLASVGELLDHAAVSLLERTAHRTLEVLIYVEDRLGDAGLGH